MIEAARKPAGGFVFVSAMGLIASWWAYKRRLLEFRDVRVWLASHELLATRCRIAKGRVPRFKVSELKSLVERGTETELRASVRRLRAVGLLKWTESELRHPKALSELTVPSHGKLVDFVEQVKNCRRRVPVPRRLLAELCATKRPAFFATAVGHLLRCSYYRNRECRARGLCKASWIAAQFEVNERSVKAARSELFDRGMFLWEPTPQRVMNRYGLAVLVNLEWVPKGRGQGRISPLLAKSTAQISPPKETGNSLKRS